MTNVRKIRILILLYLLLTIAGTAWLTKARSTDWNNALNIAIYPINGDKSLVTQTYIDSLDNTVFDPIEDFFSEESTRYGLTLQKPVKTYLSRQLETLPPAPPHGGSTLAIMYWSLKLRFWAWWEDNYKYPKDIQVFIIYFDPDKNPKVAHSLGLQKGLLGVVNAFANKRLTGDNNVIIAHEILHTLGAIDKYESATNMPLYPVGYAEPERVPLFPQVKAEIMGGRIPINQHKADIPINLNQVVIGKSTAIEINWINLNE